MPTTNTRAVAWLTAVMMVVEIVAGWWYNSMALLADGFHMSSHALAWDGSGDELNDDHVAGLLAAVSGGVKVKLGNGL